MKIKLLKQLLFLCIMLSTSVIFAQTVTGTVSDANGPLPGASVVVKGTENGTESDFDGKFTLNDVASDAVLVVSFVGFVTKEVNVNGQSNLTIIIEEDANQLSEVVVVGYTTQTRGDVTGSVASVDVGEANKAPIVNIAEALDGRVSGVTIINNGNPGASPTVRIRGLGTVNNNNPLYIIDGVQTTDGSILNSINPSDVDQINVLKDGAASIYGARASNGVIIVTTKNGRYNQGKAIITLNAYTGSTQATNLPDLLNAQQLGDVLFESTANDGSAWNHPQYGNGGSAVVPSQLQGVPVSATVNPNGTDWLDEIFQNATTQNVDFTMSNGSEESKYSFSAGYLNREGQQLSTGFKRGLIRLNSEFKVGKRITVGEHLSTSLSISNGGNEVQNALRVSPLIPVRDDNGVFAGGYSNAFGLGNATNPVANLLNRSDNFFKQSRILGDVYMVLDLVDGLKFKTSIGGDINSFNDRNFTARNPWDAEPRPTNSLSEQNQNYYNWTFSNTLNYVKSFDNHNINLLVGLEAVRNAGKGSQSSVTGFLFETPDFYTLTTGTGTPVINFAFDNESTLNSIFGSVNYSYSDKYYVTATLRNDESSNFSSDNTSDIFPSFSAGWVLSNEDFYPADAVIGRVKLKGSWGQLGNQSVPTANPSINISSLNLANANYPFNGNLTTGAILASVGNPNLTWETSETLNIGLELGMLENRLTFSAEYFTIETKNLIAQDFSLINDTAIDAAAPFVNIGAIENKGFDFSVGYHNETDSGFTFGIDATLSTYKNEVTDLVSAFQVGDGIPFTGTTANRTTVGQPIASFYGRIAEGIYRTEAEVAAGPDQGFATDADGVGRLRYRDLDGNNIIDDSDRTFIGSPHPDITYGVNLSASYKNFDISAFISGVSGNEIYNGDRVFTDFPTFFDLNRSTRVLNSFNATTNPTGSAPALSANIRNDEIQSNSYFVEDGSYMRLKNLQIGYSLPETIIDEWGLDQLRFYVTGSNLFTITDYTGIDPEIQPSNGASALTLGLDVNNNPLAQVFLVGVNIKL